MSYEAFIRSCIDVCRCCHECQQLPCAGTMAGGMCDRMCWCTDDLDEDDLDDRFDEDANDRPAEITRLANEEPGTWHEKDTRTDREKRGEESK